MKKKYQVFISFDSANKFAKEHAPSLLRRNNNDEGWLVEYNQPNIIDKQPCNKGASVQNKNEADDYYKAAISLQKKLGKDPNVQFEDVCVFR